MPVICKQMLLKMLLQLRTMLKTDMRILLKKLTSDVWNDFERITNTDESQSAKCIHCLKQLVAGSTSGTSHLRNHLARCNSKNKTGIAQYLIATKKLIIDDLVSVENFKFNEENSRMDFAKTVIKDNYPFSMCGHEYFEIVVNGL